VSHYKLTAEAKEDLRNIYHYGFMTFGELQADKYFLALMDRLDEIAENPYIYPKQDDIRQGYHRGVCGVDSIYYKVSADSVEIIAIIGRQDIGRRFSE
jgi:toxin ParE1/3/4